MHMKKSGRFIVFEGLDGSGKTSQLHRLAKHLGGVVCTAQPSTGVIGGLLRSALKKELVLPEQSMALLFAADRCEHIERELKPQLMGGNTVLCDRYVFSNLAYQSTSMPMGTVLSYNQAAIDFLMPDITVYLDAQPQACAARIAGAGRPEELYENLASLKKVAHNFDKAFALLDGKTKLIRIDGNQSEDKVFEDICAAVLPLLQDTL